MRVVKVFFLIVLCLIFVFQAISPIAKAYGSRKVSLEPAHKSALKGEPLVGGNGGYSGADDVTIENNKVKLNDPIVGEKVELRSAYTKHFQHRDGTYTAVLYPFPVHYLASTGKWEEYDNSLVLNNERIDSKGQATYTPTSTPLDIRLPQNIIDNTIVIGKNGYTLTIGVNSNNKTINPKAKSVIVKNSELQTREKIRSSDVYNLSDKEIKNYNTEIIKVDEKNSSAKYEEVFDNADLTFDITSAVVKETIEIKEKSNIPSYSFDVGLNGLIQKKQNNGSIALYDNSKSEYPIFVINAPYMLDSSGEECHNIEMYFENNSLTITPDSEWLNESNRQFPVYLIPSISVSPSSVSDAYVSSLSPNKNYGDNEYLNVGKTILTRTRSYLKFSLPELPEGSVIYNATLGITQNNILYGNTSKWIYAFDLSRVSIWNSDSITWNNQPVSTDVDGPQNDGIQQIDYQYYLTGSGNKDYIFDITKSVRNWYEGRYNNGFLLTSNDESANCSSRFFSSDNSSGNRPVITVSYSNNIGYENYWEYETVENSDDYEIPFVNLHNGSLTYIKNDISMTGNLMPIQISHVYNSNAAEIYSEVYSDMSVGLRFHLNIQEALIPISQNSDLYGSGYRYKYFDSDGTLHYYIQSGNEIIDSFDPSNKIIVGGNVLYREDAAGNKKYFDSNHKLYRIEDKNGNAQIISYSGSKITQVTDPVGRKAVFSYDNNNNLISITDNVDRIIGFVYTEDNNNTLLTEMSFPGNRDILLDYSDYSSKNRLTKVDHQDFRPFLISYNNKKINRVYSISKRYSYRYFYYSQSDETGFSSGNTSMTMSSSINAQFNFSFDRLGHALTKTNGNGQTEYLNYCAGNNYYKINKLENKSELQAISQNMLKNHGFEGSGYWTSLQCINGSYEITDEMHSVGRKSLKLIATGENSIIEIDQDLGTIPQINAGVFSISLDVFFKPSAPITEDERGIAFGATYMYNNSTWQPKRSEWINGTNGWERFSLSGVQITGAYSNAHFFIEFANCNIGDIAYIDNIQIEMGDGPGCYNLVENSDFSYETNAPSIGSTSDGLSASKWSGINLQSADGIRTNGTRNCFVINGLPDTNKVLYQNIEVNKEAGQTLIFGGKAAAYASNIENNRLFEIQVTLFYDNSTETDTLTLKYDPSIDGAEQLRSTAVKLTADCTYAQFKFIYSKQIGKAYFYDAFAYISNYGNHFEYDNRGALISVSNGYDYTENYSFASDSSDIVSIEQTTGGKSSTIKITYDSNRNITEIENPEESKIGYSYNNSGQVLTHTVSTSTQNSSTQNSSTESVTYIQNGNYVKTFTDADGITTTYTYDNNDQAKIGLIVGISKSNGESQTFTYDPNTDELLSKSVPGGSGTINADVNITYADGKISNINHNSTDYSFTYSYGNLNEAYIGQNLLFRDSYNNFNQLLSRSYPNYQTYYRSYNSDDLSLSADRFESTVLHGYRYGKNGKVSTVIELPMGLHTYYYIDYALYGLPAHVIGTDKTKALYEYDMAGNLSHYTFSKDNNVIYEGNYHLNDKALPELVTVEGAVTANMQYVYDHCCRVLSSTCGPIINEYAYSDNSTTGDFDKKPTQYSVKDFTGNTLMQYSLQYDSSNNLVSTASGSNSTYYTYNELNQLTSETIGNDTYTYTYDSGGNIIKVSKGYSVEHTFVYGNSDWKDQLTSYDSHSITYNAGGNPISYKGYRMNWTRYNCLNVFSGNGTNAIYMYKGKSTRCKKILNGVDTDYTYSGDLLMRQVTGDDVIDFSYDFFGNPIGFNYNGNSYYYVYDCLGNIVNVVEPTGNIVATYTYDAWGKILSSSGTLADINPIRYKGYYYDSETGFYYLKSRYYNPEWHRFLSPDTEMIAGNDLFLGCNMYSYCYYNPIKYTDSEGKAPNLRDTMINAACELIRISDKVIAFSLAIPTSKFFEVVNGEILEPIKEKIGNDFVSNPNVQFVLPFFEAGAKKIIPFLLGNLTETFDRPIGLRNLMPVFMNGGAVWAQYFLGFKPDGNGNYVSPDDGTFMWQSLAGYSMGYDYFFSLGGPIFRRLYEFQNTVGNKTTYYVVWIWKGDYWNLGAGAEIGIYKTDSFYSYSRHFYEVDPDLKLTVDILIKYHEYFQTPYPIYEEDGKAGWWICFFTPQIQFPKVDWIDVYLNVKFNDTSLFAPFYSKYCSSETNWIEVTIPSIKNNYQFDITY